MHTVFILFILFFVSNGEVEVIHGNEENFGSIIEDNEFVIVYYHQDSDSSTKLLAEFVKNITIEVVVMEVDCKKESNICISEKIKALPTTILYHETFDKRYNTLNYGIIESVILMQKGMQEITSLELGELISTKSQFVLYQSKTTETSNYHFIKYLSHLIGYIPFYHYKGEEEKVVLYHSVFPTLDLTNRLNNQLELLKEIASYSLPTVSELTGRLIKRNDKRKNVLVYIVNNENEITNEFITHVNDYITNYKDIIITYSSPDRVITSALPFNKPGDVFIITRDSKVMKPINVKKENADKQIEEYIKSFYDKKLERHIMKSELIKESEKKLAREINYDEFEKYKKDWKDALIFLCDKQTTCKDIMNVINEVSYQYITAEDMEIAYIDVKENTVDTCTTKYPSVVLYSGIDKTRECTYDSRPITTKGIYTFLREMSKFGIGSNDMKKDDTVGESELIRERAKRIEKRADLESKGPFKEELERIKRNMKRKNNYYNSKVNVQQALDLQNTYYSYFDGVRMWLQNEYHIN